MGTNLSEQFSDCLEEYGETGGFAIIFGLILGGTS